MRWHFLASVLAIGLAGCQAAVVSSTPRSIVYRNTGDQQAISAQAQAHCSQHGRDAENVPDAERSEVAFRCVDR